MARLPTAVDIPAPRGARPSGRGMQPTDFGLDDLAGAVARLGQAQMERDDRKAQDLLRGAQGEYETGYAERAAAYDGREPGFANAETGHFALWAQGLLERPDVGSGVRYALKQRLDAYQAQAGQRAIGAEADRRASIITEQKQAQTAQNVSKGLTDFNKAYGDAYQALESDYDGSTSDFADRAGKAADEAAAAALANVPEADRAVFQTRMSALKPGLVAQALEYQQKRQNAYLVDGVKAARAGTINTVLGNPAAYDLAIAAAPEMIAGLPKAMHAPVLRDISGDLAAARIQGLIQKGELDTATAELNDGRYDRVMDPAVKTQLMDMAAGRSARLATDLIEAMRFGGDVDPEAARRAAANSRDPGLQAKVDFALTVGAFEGEALSAFGAGGSKKGFAEAVNFVIDDLEGGEGNIRNDNGKGLSRFGINQAANPDLNVATMTRGQAVARYRAYWNAVGASTLPPGLAVAAFDAAVLMGPDKARGFLAESGGDVGKLLALEQSEMRRLAAADPKKYGDDLKGWLNRVEKVRAEAARRQAFANVADGLTSDPLKYALGGSGRAPLAAVPALPDTPSGPAWRAALQGRLQVGDMMRRNYRAPLRMLTDAEAAFYKDAIARDPTAAVDFAREAVAAVGPVAARSLMGELGKQGDAGVTLHLADLSARGLDRYADQAARGMALKGQGVSLEKPKADSIRGELERMKAVFAGMPELRAAAQATAEAAMLADQQSGEPKDARYYVLGALGAADRKGQTFGGVTRLNGADTLIPSWLSPDHADEALDVMADAWAATGRGPVYTNGQAVPASALRKARLQLLANGHYLILDNQGRALQAKGGRPFTFDWDDARDALKGRLGGRAVAE